jgi:hypothetical protein
LKVPVQASLVEHNQVIQAFGTNSADHTFHVSSLQSSAQTETEGTLESEDR